MADIDETAPEAEENEETQEANEDKEEQEAEELEEVEEEAIEESEVDPFELLDETSEDNEEQQRMYREYLDLTKQIDGQNAVIKKMKDRRNELMDRQCKTRKERAEIKQLRTCIDQESVKLHTMTNRAVQLQNFGSPRLYGDIELPTSVSEENYFITQPNYTTFPRPSSSRRPQTAQDICDACKACDPCKNCNDSSTDSDDTCCE